MLHEPKRFSGRHWWNFVTLALLGLGVAVWAAGLVDGRLVLGAIVLWLILAIFLVPALIQEHLGFLDRWVFHDYQKAHERYRRAVNTKKATPEAHCALASLAYAEGDLGEAARLLEEASHSLPSDPHLHYLLSRVLSKQGRHEEAVAEAIRVRELRAGGVLGDLALGDALAAKADMLSAASAYQKVISRKPDLVHARVGLAKAYLALGRDAAAAEQVDETLRLAPSNSDVLYLAGKVAAVQDRPEDARKLLQSALDSRPVDDQARLVPYAEIVSTLCEAGEIPFGGRTAPAESRLTSTAHRSPPET
ncbi:MAG: tetratricopeptide repeat protein [Bacillota bacterium]|jgi:tetratricopeptide (TPR) repeat protein